MLCCVNTDNVIDFKETLIPTTLGFIDDHTIDITTINNMFDVDVNYQEKIDLIIYNNRSLLCEVKYLKCAIVSINSCFQHEYQLVSIIHFIVMRSWISMIDNIIEDDCSFALLNCKDFTKECKNILRICCGLEYDPILLVHSDSLVRLIIKQIIGKENLRNS